MPSKEQPRSQTLGFMRLHWASDALTRWALPSFCMFEAVVLVVSRNGIRAFGVHSGYFALATLGCLILASSLTFVVLLVSAVSASKRNWKLRTFLLWVLMWLIGLAAFGNECNRVRRLRAVRDRLEFCHGAIGYECERTEQFREIDIPFVSQLLWESIDLLGVEFVQDVDTLELCSRDGLMIAAGELAQLTDVRRITVGSCNGFRLEDADVASIAVLGATELDIQESELTSHGILEISRIQKLRYLRIGGSRLTETDACTMTGLDELESLKMVDCQIGDGFLRNVSRLPKIRLLELQGTGVSDEGVKEIQKLSACRVLILDNNCITDRAIATICMLPKLEMLGLKGTCITDAGMDEIGGLSQLVFLDISETSVTDSGIMSLSRLGRLRYLRVNGTDITENGIRYIERLPLLESLEVSDGLISPSLILQLKARRGLSVVTR